MIKQNGLAGSFTLHGTRMTVNRMGYGAMQLAGRDGNKLVWGPPRDVDGAIAVLREAIASGVNHIDTADFYGPHVTNQIIRKALSPFPDDLVIVTKISARRGEDGSWIPAFSREELTAAVHDNLRNLGMDVLDVVNLRAMFNVHGPAEGSIEAPVTVLAELQQKGLIRNIGLSNVTSTQIAEARRIAPIVCVQNHYNLAHRTDDALIDDLARDGIAYVPFFPLGGFTPAAVDHFVRRRRAPRGHANAGCTCMAPPAVAQYPGDPWNIVYRASSREPRGCETSDSCGARVRSRFNR